jgi:topoisomerase-4 subunit A
MVTLFAYKPGAKRLLASSSGDGFIAAEDDLLAQTRAGRQVLNLGDGAVARICVPAAGDAVASVGENRKVLVFGLDEMPELGRGKGVRLQKFKDGGLSDAIVFVRAAGLTWKDPAGRTRTVAGPELDEYVARRGSAGRMAPRGFPRDNRFS